VAELFARLAALSAAQCSVLAGRPSLRRAIFDVAACFWQRGWVELKGGSITFNMSAFVDSGIRAMLAIGMTLPRVVGLYFDCKGTNKRMRDLAREPMEYGSLVRVCEDGAHYEIVADTHVQPTSGIRSHLAFHNRFQERGDGYVAVVHTHPTELVATSHAEEFLKKLVLSRIL